MEETLLRDFAPYIANTHTETSFTGHAATAAYQQARAILKAHVGANADDVLLGVGTAARRPSTNCSACWACASPPTTSAPPRWLHKTAAGAHHPHGHHSNHTTWLECDVDLR